MTQTSGTQPTESRGLLHSISGSQMDLESHLLLPHHPPKPQGGPCLHVKAMLSWDANVVIFYLLISFPVS